jgi:hypothetical protein
MEDARFNAIFNEDLDDDYKSIMDRVVDHINYCGNDHNGGSGGDDDDGENDDDDDNDSDEDDESFWKRDSDMKKLVVCTAGAINMYYINCMHKESCMVSYMHVLVN